MFRRRRFFQGRAIHGAEVKDIEWFRIDGQMMNDDDWNTGFAKSLGVLMNGKGISETDTRGDVVTDDIFYTIFNAHYEPLDFVLPDLGTGGKWVKMLDASEGKSVRAKAGRSDNFPIPANEEERLQELLDLHILDTEPEETFDNITALAAQICQTPIALVTLIDAERQWFKSIKGLEINETPREQAFATHTIMDVKLLEVFDALDDERFANNPLVVSDPKIRFYAGAPIVTERGNALGSLCVMDSTPRQLTEDQKDALIMLSRQVALEFETRRKMMLLMQESQRQGQYLEQTEIGSQIYPPGATVSIDAQSMVLLRLAE